MLPSTFDTSLVKYFAYGSNLWLPQLASRIAPWTISATVQPLLAFLPGFRVAFNVQGDDGNFYANIARPGDGVFGIVYSCDLPALERLDLYEAGYTRQWIRVLGPGLIPIDAYCYVGTQRDTQEGTPRAAYLDRIMDGARWHKLPHRYICALEATRNLVGMDK